ncbi:MAG: hypothetical protein ACOYK9_00730 [Chlamydiia bacterium]
MTAITTEIRLIECNPTWEVASTFENALLLTAINAHIASRLLASPFPNFPTTRSLVGAAVFLFSAACTNEEGYTCEIAKNSHQANIRIIAKTALSLYLGFVVRRAGFPLLSVATIIAVNLSSFRSLRLMAPNQTEQ